MNNNKLSTGIEEIKAIKSAGCIMDYDAKTEIINQKMKAIQQLDMIFKTVSVVELSK